jgi:hypothetical protein
MQLKPEFCSFWVTICSAWKPMSAALHGPGTTMVGPTPPSSEVTRRWLRGVPFRLLLSPS